MELNEESQYEITIKGLVQGVGFRPFVYRLAQAYGLKGKIANRNDAVEIVVNCDRTVLEAFINELKSSKPAAASIHEIKVNQTDHGLHFDQFIIEQSRDVSSDITQISPDIGVCAECLSDIKVQPRRIDYPFVNCTECGPRFSIIRSMPYDRRATSMDIFDMCPECRGEYEDVRDRRFHAQPVACGECGPVYELNYGNDIIDDPQQVVSLTAEALEQGKLIAFKGLGGFLLTCDATNNDAVKAIRKRKFREGKPLAVMFADLERLKNYAETTVEEEEALLSWRRPIVLLKKKKQLAYEISKDYAWVGAMLPYMPFHYLLFEALKIPALAMTSGNFSGEPILIKNEEALNRLGPLTDAVLTYNRAIYNRVDDSVSISINGINRLVRRSRGYVPQPVYLNLNVEGILAAGAELANCFCIGKGRQAIMSQHVGDLKHPAVYEFFEETIGRYKSLFRFTPELAVHDLHPDYFSTRYAQDSGLHTLAVQHHHAHIASCMAENNLDEHVIGVCMDGMGLGVDGEIWGGEFFVADLNDYERVAQFEYIPQPGGDKAAMEPWRMAVAYLAQTFGRKFLNLELSFLKGLPAGDVDFLLQAIDKRINCPLTSSAGRLFDAVAGLLGLCLKADFHAQPPMLLEGLTKEGTIGDYLFEENNGVISFRKTIEGIVDDLLKNEGPEIIATKFHNTVISAIFNQVELISDRTGLRKIALSGGVFQNKFLSQRIESRLTDAGYKIYVQREVPANDGGLALGQLAIAAKRRESGKI